MAQSSREIVQKCLTFNYPERIPRQFWVLPWASKMYPQAMKKLEERFPSDFAGTDYLYKPSPKIKGDAHKIGKYTDEWGCTFENLQEGIIGEVRQPILTDISDWDYIEPPYGQLPTGELEIQKAYDTIKKSYEKTDKFVIADFCPRPWERMQFLRGTENAMIDIMMPELGGADLLKKINDFYLKEMELWVKSDVDGICFMDDWGAQNQLLVSPDLWRQTFKPIYKEFCDLAKSYGKYVFMHSDGYILDIYPEIIEIGVHAINSQLFCMDFSELNKIAKGKITFWGEIDRQHILPSKDPQDGRDAVQMVANNLYDPNGGIIAQLEFGPGANPETVLAVFDEWAIVQEM